MTDTLITIESFEDLPAVQQQYLSGVVVSGRWRIPNGKAAAALQHAREESTQP